MYQLIEKIELHKELNPKIWDGNKLRPEVKDKLNEIVEQFILELQENEIPIKILDARLVGSNASFNYTKDSDLDIHLIANFEDASCDINVLSLLYNFFKKNFNDKYDISIHGVPIEMYIEDMNSSAVSNGVYSLFNDEWIKFPKPIDVPDIDITDTFYPYEQRYEEILKNKDSDEAEKLIDELYLLRKDSISTDGEYGIGNLVFKEFRNLGYLDNLKKMMTDETSKELSLESINEAKEDNQKLINHVGQEIADKFFKLKSRIKSPENDLYYWLKKEPVELSDFLSDLENTKSKTQQRNEDKKGAKLLYNKNGWKIYRIDTYQAAVYYGKNTKWCITGSYPGAESDGEYFFDNYKRNGVKNYYFIISPDNHKWCYLDTFGGFVDDVLWDEEDNGIDNIYDTTFPDIPNDAFSVLPNIEKIVKKTHPIIKLRRSIIQTHKLELTMDNQNLIKSVYPHDTPTWLSDNVFELIIKNDVEKIYDKEFIYFYNIKKLTIESGIKEIGDTSFGMCDELQEVNIPNSVIEIKDRAFFGCDSLTKVYIPGSVKKIGMSTFYASNKNLTIYCDNSEEFTKNNYAEDWNLLYGDLSDNKRYAKVIYSKQNKNESFLNILKENYKTKEWIKQQFSDAFNKYSGGNKNLLKAKLDNITDGEWEDIEDYVNSIKFPLTIYRGLKVKSENDINLSNIGINWTIDDELFFDEDSAFKDSNYVIVAKIDEDQVDWGETIQNYIYYSLRPQEGRWAESEITLKKGFNLLKAVITKKEEDSLEPVKKIK